MAGLCTGISYGLSQNNLNNNKELVFVKLTDSAYRAIEEYQRNQAKINLHPTIQFDGNDGFLSFPSVTNSLGQKFSFTITEIEGPQGSFECIQQSQGHLDILGSLTTKMRIHAKDDVYETTRVRMAEAEETQKKKSTREIKPNQTDIGRKVKLKNSFDRISNIPNNNLSKRDSSQNNSISSINNNNNNNLINNINNNNNNSNSIINSNLNSINSSNVSNQSSLLGITSSLASGLGTGTTSSLLLSSSKTNNQSGLVNNNTNNSCSNLSINNTNNLAALSNSNTIGLLSQTSGNGGSMNGLSPGGNLVNNINNSNVLPISNGCQNGIQKSGNNRNSSQNNNNNVNNNNSGSRNNDLMKRPIKERLIHLLAVRPYKKPEVYARITSEGVRERDKSNIGNVLKAISFLRDNSYHLHRYIWNDVQEDWPFYSEQEKATLKRRKPQNLTPPLSSDGGSSTSGQSPTSTHNGSPPPPVKRPSMMNEKVLEGPMPKKQRISHYKKDNVTQENTTSRRGTNDSRDSSNMNPRSREPEEPVHNNYFTSSTVTPNAHESEDSGMSLSYSVLNTEAAKRITSTIPTTNNQDLEGHDEEQHELQVEMENQKQLLNGGSPNNHDFSKFARISTIEQRRKYKTEFDKDYAEYRQLYDEIDQTSKRFELLGERLRSEKHNNKKYKDIQKQILAEYKQKMRDSHHQLTKRRFDYLHQKLSLIKRLVNEYDTTLTKNKHLTQQNY